MVSQTIIMLVLFSMLIFGLGGVIASIALLASKTVKGSTFWAGVLTMLIYVVITAIITAILTFTKLMPTDYAASPLWVAIISVASSIVFVLCCFVAEKNALKNKTVKGALSFATGIGAFNLISIGFSQISIYSLATMINSGAFDQTYSQAVQMGAITKEDVLTLKSTVTGLTMTGMIGTAIANIALVMAYFAVILFIMKGVTNKKSLPDLLVSIVLISVMSVAGALINNELIASVIDLVIAAAALIYAVKIRTDIKEPEPVKIEADSFMQSIAEAQGNIDENTSEAEKDEEFNPYK